MKVYVGLVGKGKWGKKLKKQLDELTNLKFFYGKKNTLISDIKKEKIKWVFVATPNITHYKIVKQCIQNGVNVFCEKPLCISYTKAKKLIDYSRKKRVKLFVSDIYNYYSVKIKNLKNINYIFRSKYVGGDDNEYLFRFMYHDVSILYKFLKSNRILNFLIKNQNKKKIFEASIELKNKIVINFIYNLNIKKKEHLLNKLVIRSEKDILKMMITNVLSNKVDFKKNNNKALFILKFLEKLKKQAKYVY